MFARVITTGGAVTKFLIVGGRFHLITRLPGRICQRSSAIWEARRWRRKGGWQRHLRILQFRPGEVNPWAVGWSSGALSILHFETNAVIWRISTLICKTPSACLGPIRWIGRKINHHGIRRPFPDGDKVAARASGSQNQSQFHEPKSGLPGQLRPDRLGLCQPSRLYRSSKSFAALRRTSVIIMPA